MVAAVALERSGSPLRDAVSLSVARFTRPSPYSFLLETLTHRNFITPALRSLLLLLIISTFAVQLSSTILLNDLEIRPVEGFLQHSSGTYEWDAGFDAGHSPFENQQKYWTGLSKTFNLFAESSNKPSLEPAADQIIGDTGPTLRTFLPINDQTVRRNLMRYSGFATVFDARIVCLRPDIVTGSVSDGSIDTTLKLPSVSDIMRGITTTDQEFGVSVPRIHHVATKAWSIVPLTISVGGMVSSLDPASRQNASLVFEPYGPGNRKPNRFAGKVSPDGVWRTSDELACGVDLGNAYLIMDSGQDPALVPDVSPKSFLYHQIQDFEITASGPGNMSEPQTTFRSETEPDDIPVLRTQLAATDESEAMDMISRGLLNLTSAESIRTTLLRDVYYTWIIRFDSESEVDMAPSVPVQVPAGYLGFWVVMGIIFLHLGICMVSFIAFAMFTNSSRLGSGWQAVADIVKHEDGERIIDQLRQLDDAHLDAQLKAEAAQGRTFVIR
ncbi:hypothetical protein F5X68DRAFT_229047 [Plectosphaerella plurivora]|uniref:Uncharacterized protein n=1 Tax=Plectosphaerella plurivora TaxID=936078 RepID=A0A9P8VIJ8_9PEZI|nr:hypothetical protein F5X68DRAFT_229047 [Plectosphaerella plurivora]